MGKEFFKTNDGKPGIQVTYCNDKKHEHVTKQQVEENIDHIWYQGRPEYLTDSAFSIRWEGKLVPKETGKYQFHMKSFDGKRISIDGKQLPVVYTSVEQYTDTLSLVAGKKYSLLLEMENNQTGAALMRLFWKTPSIFADEIKKEDRSKTRTVYLPQSTLWYDFWTGTKQDGGQKISAPAPIDIIPLFVPAGSIIPMGPFLQYATEKPANPIELRLYPGADGNFTLYEDENDNYNYEKGVYATIDFKWKDSARSLVISKRNGTFPGMMQKRTFNIVVVGKDHGVGLDISAKPDKTVTYDGNEMEVAL